MAVIIDKLNQQPVSRICDGQDNRPDALLEILHAVQAERGYLTDRDLRDVADKLNISRAEIHGVVSFYHDFKRDVPAPHAAKICRAEACQAVGGEDLAAHVQETLAVGGDLRAELGDVDIEAVYCLGNCALGPAVMLDGELFGRVTPERFNTLARAIFSPPGLKAGKA